MVIDVAAVGQRVEGAEGGRHGAGDGEDIAPGVVGVLHNCHIAGVYNGDDISLQIGHIVANRAVPSDRPRCTKSIIREVIRVTLSMSTPPRQSAYSFLSLLFFVQNLAYPMLRS